MKHALLSFFLLLTIIFTTAQTWCPPGSVWVFRSMAMMNELGEARYNYIKDTIYEGQLCHQLYYARYPAFDGFFYSSEPNSPYHQPQNMNFYTYSSADTAFIYYEAFNKWMPVYYFAANIGDTLTMPLTMADSMGKVVVDSAGIMAISGNPCRWYSFHTLHCGGLGFESGRIIEGIGPVTNDLLPFWHCVTDDSYYTLCNYTNNDFTYNPDGSAYVCQLLLSSKELEATSKFSLSPNPATQTLTITALDATVSSKITLSDVTGKIVNAFTLTQTSVTLPVADYTPGVYTVTMQDVQGFIASKRIVITHGE